jgi:RNA polymerase sigma-70 factor (ECF subfamily)
MWPDESQTRTWLEQIGQGKPEATDALLAAHREPLRRMIQLRLDPALAARMDASDVVQSVLLEVHCRLGDYLREPAMPFHLWLRHIAQDHIIDAYRRHRQAQRRSLDREQPLVPAFLADHSSIELAAQLIDQEHTPATAAIQQELLAKLQTALTQLEDADREIILMRHGEQLSNKEVASLLDLTEAAASMRYLRAIRRLREVLLSSEDRGP